MKPLNVYLYQAGSNVENFGEYLCIKILNQLGYNCNRYSKIQPIKNDIEYILTAIGGNLNLNRYREFKRVHKWYVWGSGFGRNLKQSGKVPQEIIDTKCNITMIRGPLTRDFLGLQPSTFLGDPGYLASYFFKFPKKDQKSVFIQFYYDKIPRKIIDADINSSALLTNDIDKDFYNISEQISSAKIVLTASMHAMIAAHSYGVPWALTSKEHTDLSKEFKWHDTLATIGLDKSDIRLCNTMKEGLEWWDSIKHKVKPITKEYQEQIIKAFPL